MTPRELRALRYCVIDDSLAERRIIADTLRAFGARTVLEESSAGRALDRLDMLSPDVIVLDWYMPNLDGAGFLTALHESTAAPAPLIIVATAFPTAGVVAQVARFRVHGLIRKPFSPRTLYDRLLALPAPPTGTAP